METDRVSEELPGWEDVQSPFSAVTAKFFSNDEESPAVAVKDDFYGESSAALPPGKHEDLPINPRQADIKSEPLVNPPSQSDGDDDGSRRARFGDGILGIIAGRFREYVGWNKVGYLSAACAAGGVAAAVLVVLCLRRRKRVMTWRRRRVELESSNKSLLALVKEKDKKIEELLVEMARMKEAIAGRRRVPVVRVR
ncbi:uncharacterized protein LOC127245446 [Andrographis paniculata]|uniref:uncharacterized protein LOC127245446 n=1 Tax=Andrographis paniculata TaxID=175694 RepID=UPI0021E8E92A|nr:uncharacterized protein LOC127245446 [Andrographis paniculata]